MFDTMLVTKLGLTKLPNPDPSFVLATASFDNSDFNLNDLMLAVWKKLRSKRKVY